MMLEYADLCKEYPPTHSGNTWVEAGRHIEWMLGKRGHGRKRSYVMLPSSVRPATFRGLVEGCSSLDDLVNLVKLVESGWKAWLAKQTKPS